MLLFIGPLREVHYITKIQVHTVNTCSGISHRQIMKHKKVQNVSAAQKCSHGHNKSTIKNET